jgi:hypothetical protein
MLRGGCGDCGEIMIVLYTKCSIMQIFSTVNIEFILNIYYI